MICYTDGSTRPTNPGPGGFGVVILDDNGNLIEAYSKQYDEKVTNNKMELSAILYAAARALGAEEAVTIYTDSAYALQCITKWAYTWKQNGWIKGDGNPPENLDMIKILHEWYNKYPIEIKKVKAHVGDKWNELADDLAAGRRMAMKI